MFFVKVSKVFTLATPNAALSYRIVSSDDIEDVDDAAGIGGIVITGLSSGKPGDASKLLGQLLELFPKSKVAVVAYAASGDHDRLYSLYGKFGFQQEGHIPSLRVRY